MNQNHIPRDWKDKQMIKLIKVKSLLDEPHPNSIEEGYERIGYMLERPEVGKKFIIYGPGLRLFTTSVVTLIEDDFTFQTENSIYKFEKTNIIDQVFKPRTYTSPLLEQMLKEIEDEQNK